MLIFCLIEKGLRATQSNRSSIDFCSIDFPKLFQNGANCDGINISSRDGILLSRTYLHTVCCARSSRMKNADLALFVKEAVVQSFLLKGFFLLFPSLLFYVKTLMI